ncbi:MAG: isoprenyl transferase [Candidatus Omnitrophica bacterium]|nr:isoprenyl transferase [Candidatus Omnitrophota bacterium]
MDELNLDRLPKHVAIIMDGNGRWAQQKGYPRTTGHIEGVKRVQDIVVYASRIGLKFITLYTFSTENWNRPVTEINMLMNTLSKVLKTKANFLKKNNIRFQMIGRMDRIPAAVLKSIQFVKDTTKDCTGLTLNLAFNYGSRLEIVDAVRQIIQDIMEGKKLAEDISESDITNCLYTHMLPDPDLLIRTSGEKRISNFLLWQLSYAEFYFTETCWPDFKQSEFKAALIEYQNRERRYGDITTKG